jgi:hypothetical protein
MTDDIHAERRIHQLEEQLRNARDDALEEAARRFDADPGGVFTPMGVAYELRKMKGRL